MSSPVTSSELFERAVGKIKQRIERVKNPDSIRVLESSLKDPQYVNSVLLICMWFTCDRRFEDEFGMSLYKGLYVKGAVGSGKSTVFDVLQEISKEIKLPRLQFRPVTSRAVASQYKTHGDASLPQYTSNSFYVAPGSRYNQVDYTKPRTFYFDDFGLELDFHNGQYVLPANYANKCNVMAEILLDRYYYFVKHGMITHLSTNINDGGIIESMYGLQVRSRMREMFNQIELTSTDKRV